MNQEIPGDYKFPCQWCGGIRFVDPRRKGDHIRCAVMRAWRWRIIHRKDIIHDEDTP